MELCPSEEDGKTYIWISGTARGYILNHGSFFKAKFRYGGFTVERFADSQHGIVQCIEEMLY